MHGVAAVLRMATVVSMVPAAPLLPTIDPTSLAVAHRTAPAEVVDEADAEVVDEVDGVPLVEVGAPVVVEDDDPEEHAPTSAPPMANPAARPMARTTFTP